MTAPETGSGWEVLALRYASRPTTRGEVFYRDPGPDGPLQMAYYLWVLRGREATILVDTGYSAQGGRHRGRGHAIAPLQALRAAGIDPRSVDLVVNTHLHYDHTGHLADFSEVPLLVSATELEAWTGPLAQRAQFAVHVEADEIAAVARRARAGSVTAMGPEHEVAPGVTAVEVGGHSPGQVILVIDGRRSRIVLASDAVHYYEEVDDDRACGVLVDLARVYRAYDTIRELVAAPGAQLLAGHDPTVMDRFARLPGDAHELGVSLT